MTSAALPPAFTAPWGGEDAILAARLLPGALLPPEREARVDALATRLIGAIRGHGGALGGVEDMLREYALSTREGLALMVLAEALLRVPDSATADRLILIQVIVPSAREFFRELPRFEPLGMSGDFGKVGSFPASDERHNQ